MADKKLGNVNWNPGNSNVSAAGKELIDKARDARASLLAKNDKPYDANSAVSRLNAQKPYSYDSIRTDSGMPPPKRGTGPMPKSNQMGEE